jgi:Fic family protein
MMAADASRTTADLSRATASETALRDISDLLRRGLLEKNEGGGRSASYSLAEGPAE